MCTMTLGMIVGVMIIETEFVPHVYNDAMNDHCGYEKHGKNFQASTTT